MTQFSVHLPTTTKHNNRKIVGYVEYRLTGPCFSWITSMVGISYGVTQLSYPPYSTNACAHCEAIAVEQIARLASDEHAASGTVWKETKVNIGV